MNPVIVGEKIKARRKELGMSQQELADAVGYTSKVATYHTRYAASKKRLFSGVCSFVVTRRLSTFRISFAPILPQAVPIMGQ